MAHDIKKVAVIGAGVMGAGIAAQVANAGVDVLLLDIVPKDAADRNVIARSAIERYRKTSPAPLMHAKNAKRITPGNIEDNLKDLKDCDWVIEAVLENLDIKHDLYTKVFKHVGKAAVVSSNTSTLPLHNLAEKLTAEQRKRLMITHFFNPPRYMRLVELITSAETDKAAARRISDFIDHGMGKTVVDAKDTPGFIANRIGTYWLHAAATQAIARKIDVETADAVLGRPAGVPKTGVFGLLDLVGLDLMPHVLGSLQNALPKDDPFHALGAAPALMDKMIKDGYTGRKGKGGFYRLNTEGGKKRKEVMNLATGEYGPARKPKVPAAAVGRKKGLRAMVMHDSPAGHYAWSVLSGTLAYAASLVPEIADDIYAVDQAMKLGYNWKQGPFELVDKLGTAWFAEKLAAEGKPVPDLLKKADGRKLYTTQNGVLHFMGTDGTYHPVTRPAGVLLLEDIKRRSAPVAKNRSASLWDVGDGVLCLEFHSKMNSLNPFSLMMVNKAVELIPAKGYKGLVLYNEGSNYSVGANILMLLVVSKLRLWPVVRTILAMGQKAYKRLQHAPFPVVGAPAGMVLGGGCESILHCDAVEAYAESYIGLVEAGVGIIPGWGGCTELLHRAQVEKGRKNGPMVPVMRVFEIIATAKVATSAAEARDLLFLRPEDGIVMNRDRVLATAKARVLSMAEGYTPAAPRLFPHLPGASAQAALGMGVREFAKRGMATPHDITVSDQLAYVISGGDTDVENPPLTEDDLLRLEREAIINLAKTPQTRARIFYMLKNGKPLRN